MKKFDFSFEPRTLLALQIFVISKMTLVDLGQFTVKIRFSIICCSEFHPKNALSRYLFEIMTTGL